MTKWRQWAVGVAALAVLLPLTGAAGALPRVGSARPDVKLVDAWERSLQLDSLKGMPVLVVYEDKESSTQNKALKDELAKLAKGDKYKKSIALVAVADVQGYDYWPVRGFVKKAIREESSKMNTVIYCDWDGGARGKLALDRGTSNVVLYGKDGKVLFAHGGAMPEAKRKELIGLLRAQVGD